MNSATLIRTLKFTYCRLTWMSSDSFLALFSYQERLFIKKKYRQQCVRALILYEYECRKILLKKNSS